jgi:hypothetical protein
MAVLKIIVATRVSFGLGSSAPICGFLPPRKVINASRMQLPPKEARGPTSRFFKEENHCRTRRKTPKGKSIVEMRKSNLSLWA